MIAIIITIILVLDSIKVALVYKAREGSSYRYPYNTVKLNWKELKQFYWVKPERWDYESNSGYLIYRETDNKYLRVKLTLNAWLLFHLHRLKPNRYHSSGMEELLKCVQADIDRIHEENSAVIRNAMEELKSYDKKDLLPQLKTKD